MNSKPATENKNPSAWKSFINKITTTCDILAKVEAHELMKEDVTMRDYFASQVLRGETGSSANPSKDASYAYDVADAMMDERKKRKG